ncbi:MAG: hypothetical protein HC775_14690 [Hyellaceae cyanobacterium CSU_1_1]|nr:hypothetical protein [Hyellaceae cyanobacterium CSU_1_1]
MQQEKARDLELSELTLELKELNEEYYAAINDIVRVLISEDNAVTDRAIASVKAENGNYFALKGIRPKELDVEAFRKDKILRGVGDKPKLWLKILMRLRK